MLRNKWKGWSSLILFLKNHIRISSFKMFRKEENELIRTVTRMEQNCFTKRPRSDTKKSAELQILTLVVKKKIQHLESVI